MAGIDLNELWLERFKANLEKVASIHTWLLILNVTIILTFTQQYQAYRSNKRALINVNKVVNKPWTKLQWLYDGTKGYLETYTETHALKWSQLCLASFAEVDRLGYMMGVPKNDPTKQATLGHISFTGKALSFYNSDLLKIVEAQRNAVNFNALDKDALGSLINIFLFDEIANTKRFKLGLGQTIDGGRFALKMDSLRVAAGKTSVMKQNMKDVLTFTQKGADFTSITDEMLQRDMRSFGDDRIKVSELKDLKATLSVMASEMSSIGEYKDQKRNLSDKIENFRSGKFLKLPVVDIEISLAEFVVLAGLLNLCILFYLKVIFNQVKHAWGRFTVTLPETITLDSINKTDLWNGWPFDMDRRIYFICLYSAFTSLTTFFAMLFGLIIFNNSYGIDCLLILIFSGIICVAVFLSKHVWKITQNAKNMPGTA